METEPIWAYCGRCNERAEIEIAYNWGPIPILISDLEPSNNPIGTIRCLGCDREKWWDPCVTVREGRDEAYELMWLWEMIDYETI